MSNLPFSPDWFSQQVIDYAKVHGRFDLPWKQPATAYRVWVSEIMLQQTQVQTVLGYFERFMHRFPTLEDLANASIDDVLEAWAGLGYYRRAHFLHQTAVKIAQDFDGVFPSTLEDLMSLPGIGRSTAGAILAQAFQICAPILDGNVKRVLARCLELEGWPEHPKNLKVLWQVSEKITPRKEVEWYTQGIMDLGARVCTKTNPACESCPVSAHCKAFQSQTQALFPHPKPPKEKPTRRCYFLVILNQKDEVMLVKRQSQGIWGGLWSLPARSLKSPDIKCSRTGAPVAQLLSVGPKLKHTFSHFHLVYKPILMRSDGFSFKNTEHAWYRLPDVLKLGLPAPIKKLLMGELSWKTQE